MPEKSENKAAEIKKGSGYGWRIFSLILSLGWIGVLCFYHPGWLRWLMLGDLFFVPLAFFALFKLAIVKNGFGLAILRVGELKSFKMRWQGYKFFRPQKQQKPETSPASEEAEEPEEPEEEPEVPEASEEVGEAAEKSEEQKKKKKPPRPEQWDVVPDPKGKSHPLGGLVFVGLFFWNSVHKYQLSWKTISYAGEIKTHEKEELDRFLLLPKSYYFEIEKAEDKNQMPLKINGQVILQMINPKKALFGVDDYLTVVLNTIKGEIVKVVRELSFYIEGQPAAAEEKTTTTATTRVEKEKMIAAIVDKVKDDKVIADLLKEYGEQLNSITISNLDPEEDQDRQATLKPVRARLEAEAVKAKAKGEADKITIEAKAKADATAERMGGAHVKISEKLKQENVSPDQVAEMTKDYVMADREVQEGARKRIILDAPEGGGGLAGTAAIVAELLKGISGGQQPQQAKTNSEESGGGIIVPKEQGSGSKKETRGGGGINTPPSEGNEGGHVLTQQEVETWLREQAQKQAEAERKKQGKGKK